MHPPACCVLRAACCVLRAACCVLRAACCVLRAACCVLRVACCVLRVALLTCAGCCAWSGILKERREGEGRKESQHTLSSVW